MDGLHLIFRSVGILDRTAIADGAFVPLIIWVVAGGVAMGWQFKNIERWTVRTGLAPDDKPVPTTEE
jgi:hypothetical protein